jgi:hypothetical protein
VTYTALAVLLFVLCAGLGAVGGPRVARPWVAASFATAMVAAQFILLVNSR